MPNYRRWFIPEGTFFFTVVTHDRRPVFEDSRAREALRQAFIETRPGYPFELFALVLLPNHLHCVWTLPPNDDDYSTRWRLIKARFAIQYRSLGGHDPERNPSRRKRSERSFWQRRFWERTIRNETELERICAYIHYNPVHHGYVRCPHAWRFSSFHRFVKNGYYDETWNCTCQGSVRTPDFADMEEFAGEPLRCVRSTHPTS